MSPPRKRLNFVLPRRSPRCSSSSSINSGNDASQREIKSWLGIGGTCLVIGGTCLVGQHCRTHRAGDCDGPQALGEGPRRGRSMPRIWELAARKLSKCRYEPAIVQSLEMLVNRGPGARDRAPSAGLRRRDLPLQARKARKVTVECNPFTAPLDGERGIPGVRDARSAGIGLDAEPLEDVPMPLAGLNDLAMGLTEEVFAKSKCLIERAGHFERPRICSDTNYGAQGECGHTEACVACDDVVEPRTAHCVLGDISAKRIDQYVHVRQDHLKCFSRSTYSRSSISWSAEESVRSIPGMGPPVALLTRGMTRFFV